MIIVKMGILEQLHIIVPLARLILILLRGFLVLQKETAVSVPLVIQHSEWWVRHLASQPQAAQMVGMGHLLHVLLAHLKPLMILGLLDLQ